MNLSDAGAKFIAGHEGLRLEPYNDPAGYATIGIGHLIAKRPVTEADKQQWGRLTEQQAYDLFRSDARRFIDAVAAAVTVPVTQNQFDALVSFAYNVGEGAFRKSTLLKKLNSGDYRAAAAEFAKWNKAGGRVLKGLTRRRAEEAALFLRTDPGGAATIQVPVAAAQDLPRLRGESKEVAHLRAYVKASGVPHRVTSTVRSKLPSRHAQHGTDGQGLAGDFAGPQPSRNSPELLAIFKAFEPVESQLYELIYSGAPYSIKRGKRVARFAVDDHWDHVHAAVDRGVFIKFPGAETAPQVEEDDVIRIITTTHADGSRAGVYVEVNLSQVKHVVDPEEWDTAKKYAAEGRDEPVMVRRANFDNLAKLGPDYGQWPK